MSGDNLPGPGSPSLEVHPDPIVCLGMRAARRSHTPRVPMEVPGPPTTSQWEARLLLRQGLRCINLRAGFTIRRKTGGPVLPFDATGPPVLPFDATGPPAGHSPQPQIFGAHSLVVQLVLLQVPLLDQLEGAEGRTKFLLHLSVRCHHSKKFCESFLRVRACGLPANRIRGRVTNRLLVGLGIHRHFCGRYFSFGVGLDGGYGAAA
jgi:hypothetical protein